MNNLPFAVKIAIAVAVCLTIGFLSGSSTSEAIAGWYSELEKPAFNPPNWIFAPVWSALYVLMGISAALIWQKGLDHPGVKYALLVFLIQLLLNALWTQVFFVWQNTFLALLEIAVLFAAIVMCAIRFFPIQKTAAYLLIPYLLWVGFAAVLNGSIWWLNR